MNIPFFVTKHPPFSWKLQESGLTAICSLDWLPSLYLLFQRTGTLTSFPLSPFIYGLFLILLKFLSNLLGSDVERSFLIPHTSKNIFYSNWNLIENTEEWTSGLKSSPEIKRTKQNKIALLCHLLSSVADENTSAN